MTISPATVTRRTKTTNGLLQSLQYGLALFGTLDRTAIQRLWFPAVGDRTTQRMLREWIGCGAIHGSVIYTRTSGTAKRKGMVYHATRHPATTLVTPTTTCAVDLIAAARQHGGLIGVQSLTLSSDVLGNGRVVALRFAPDDRYVTPLCWVPAHPRRGEQDRWYLLIPDQPHIAFDHHQYRARWYHDLHHAHRRISQHPLTPLIFTTPDRATMLGTIWSHIWPHVLVCAEDAALQWDHTVWQPWKSGTVQPYCGLFRRQAKA